uniref:Secreted protein n=1 Tax=Oryza glumipatula TaxID=40148 RepID=A0A0D9YSX0_9ORYZ
MLAFRFQVTSMLTWLIGGWLQGEASEIVSEKFSILSSSSEIISGSCMAVQLFGDIKEKITIWREAGFMVLSICKN